MSADRDTTRTFDEYNRIKTETQATGLGVEYAYDRAGRKTREFLPGSNAVDYVYNSAFMAAVRRMTNVTSLGVSGNLAYQHSYTSNDLAGNILGVSLASSQAQTFQTDSMNRRMLISGPAWTQTVASGTSGYDPAGNLKNFTVADPGSVLNFVHTYDGLYQLASEAGGARLAAMYTTLWEPPCTRRRNNGLCLQQSQRTAHSECLNKRADRLNPCTSVGTLRADEAIRGSFYRVSEARWREHLASNDQYERDLGIS